MDRRTFCISSAAAVVTLRAAGAEASAHRADRPPDAPIAPDQALFDSRFSPSRAFGAAAARAGRRAIALQGDPTMLWLRSLAPAWAAGGGAVAGMTSARTLFVLEQLARDHWRRVVLRIEHAQTAQARCMHYVTAAEPALTWVCAHLDGAQDWPERSAMLIASCPPARGGPRAKRAVIGAEYAAAPPPQPQLVSWIISA